MLANAALPEGDINFIGGLAVTVYGSGEPILMSAGLGGHGSYWKPQLEALTTTHQVILYDHRGTGDSERGELPDTYSATHLADDLKRILDGLDIEAAHIVGHAAGAVAALELARTRPERVKSVVSVNGWAKADRHFKRCFDIRTAILKTQGPLAYLTAQPLFLFPAEWISDHLDELDASAAHHAPGFQSEANLLKRIQALASFDIVDQLDQIECPVLVIATLDDMLVPVRSSVQLDQGLSDSQLIALPWGGHAVNVTVPEEFNAYLTTFLAGLA